MEKIIVANWKMYGNPAMAHPLTLAVADAADQLPVAAEIVICPPAPLLSQVENWLIGSVVKTGGQDCHALSEGAYTGDISPAMLKSVGCRYVIVGHSERRKYHGESNADISAKAAQALKTELTPIICIGESEEERNAGKAIDIVSTQVVECLPAEAASGNFVLAYEPVWAIGSGKIPSLEEIRHMHMAIVEVASRHTGLAPGKIRVLYGGSVKSDNACAIMATEGVSGVLVGGASLKAEEFCHIIASADVEKRV